ncbi:MAG: TIGR03435 family protein [Bryobacteraceae bacterium]|nr:TIGR03435 family protein [Bryobacteraceae bacterium]
MSVLLLAVALVALASAQPSVSIALPGKDTLPATPRPGLFVRPNGRVIDAVSWAYKTEPLRIVAPEWFLEARYDFVVDAGDGAPEPALRQALEEKFAIVGGWETRPVDTWILERSPQGAALRLADGERRGLEGRSGSIRGAAEPSVLARVLRMLLQREVLDETGIGGAFQISISWRPGDEDSMIRAFREAGFDLRREYRDTKVLVVYSAWWPDAPKPPRYACEPNPAVKGAIEALSSYDVSLPFEQRFASRRELVEEYPEDIFAGMAAQEVVRGQPDLNAEREWALRHYERMQDRTAADFLHARLLGKVDPAGSRALLRKVIEREPDFAWAHLALAEAAGTASEAEGALRRFRERCPSSLADAPLYERVTDPELLRAASDAFQRSLAGPIDAASLAAFPHYWRIRRRAGTPNWPANWLALDLARIRAMARPSDPAWVAALEAGRELAAAAR